MTTGDEDRAQEALKEGNRLFEAGDFGGALVAYDRSLQLRPDDSDAFNNRGVALGRLGRNEEALAAYDRTLELHPDDPDSDTQDNRGVALERLGRHKEALAAFDRSLELRPDDPETYYNRGVALERGGRYEESLASYDRSLELRPEDPDTLNNRGVALSRLGRYRQAATSYRKAALAYEASGAPHAVPHANRGEALYRLSWFHEWHLQQAVKSFRRALDLDDESLEARNGVGVCLLELGQPAAAAVEFLRAAEQAPEDADLRYNYAVACQRDRRTDRAKSELERVINEHPTFEPARRALDKLGAPPTAPDMWQWWTGGSTGRGVLGLGLLTALAVLLVSPIVYLVRPSIDSPALPWQYYVAALAVVAGALVLPAVRQFRAFGVELEPQPPRPAEAQLEPVFRQ